MDTIDKFKIMAALMRGFFEAFSSAIIDCHVTDVYEKNQPRTVKRIMVEHYGKVGKAMQNTLFYPVARMNYEYEEMVAMLQASINDPRATGDIMKLACRTDGLYKAMKGEYKRNFMALLEGRHPSVAEHLANYRRGSGNNPFRTDAAIAIVVRTVMSAYVQGLKAAGTGKATLHQPSILRLMLDAMTVLLNDTLPGKDFKNGMEGMFLKACRSQHNMEVMIGEMNRMYGELAEHEGIIANDDKAN